MKMLLIITLAGMLIEAPITEPIDMSGCTTTELGYLIQLEIPDEKITELCKESK